MLHDGDRWKASSDADYVNAQKPEGIAPIVAHETGHCALLHPCAGIATRRTIAEDHAVNLLLKASG